MSRPRKDKVDYFPHFCVTGKTIHIIENHFGSDGYAFWFKLLELLGRSKNHFYDCRKPIDLEFLSAETKLLPTLIELMLNKLAELDAIDSVFWESRIIFSENFVSNIEDAYKRTNSNVMHKLDLCIHLFGNCTHKQHLMSQNLTESAQSILKDIKGKEIKLIKGGNGQGKPKNQKSASKEEIEKYRGRLLLDHVSVERLCKGRLTPEQLEKMLSDFIEEKETTLETNWENESEFRKHFKNWIPFGLKKATQTSQPRKQMQDDA